VVEGEVGPTQSVGPIASGQRASVVLAITDAPMSLFHPIFYKLRIAAFSPAILILATTIVDEVFSSVKNQKVTPGFMQGVA
jgi:uncharacterized protein YggT (Ycf19 family)